MVDILHYNERAQTKGTFFDGPPVQNERHWYRGMILTIPHHSNFIPHLFFREHGSVRLGEADYGRATICKFSCEKID